MMEQPSKRRKTNRDAHKNTGVPDNGSVPGNPLQQVPTGSGDNDITACVTKPSDKDLDAPKATASPTHFLTGFKVYIVPAGIGKLRCDLFSKQLTKFGAVCHKTLEEETTHILVDDKMEADRLLRILKLNEIPDSVKVTKTMWLSNCIKHKQLLGTTNFELICNFKKKPALSKKDSCEDDTDTTEMKDRAENLKKLSSFLKANPTNQVTDSNDDPNEKNDSNDTVNVNSEQRKVEETNKIPKVGVMWRFKKTGGGDGDSDPESDYQPSDEERDPLDDAGEGTSSGASAANSPTKRPLLKGSWACAQASSSKKINHNKHITDKLEALAKTYENTNDKWRALGYQKAIAALKRHPHQITTWEEAKSLQGVGTRLADKIWEIMESGELQKLNELTSSEEVKAISLFTNIWGVGATTARTWVQQGLRTLEDARTKASLTRHQKIGLMHYDDLLDRMSRDEAGEIEQTVKDAVQKINPGLIAMACGSYRRGKPTCGDVDVLITHPDGHSHKGVFSKLLSALKDTGFITDDLVTQEDNGAQKKYLGVCKLPGENRKHRRLDIIVVPYDEYACAIMYFTGSAHFNRSMRHLAGKMGMSLSEHSLNVGVVRKGGEKLNKGTPLPTPTEASVFEHLGLKYRPPEERDH